MPYLSWRDDYEVGVPMIDMEHHYLFDLINAYHDKISRGAASADTAQVLNKLVTYAQKHFLHEEALMHMHNYPKLGHQSALHSKLFVSIFDLNEKFSTNQAQLEVETLQFLKHWLIDHILKEDMDIGDFMRRKEARAEKPAPTPD